MFKKRQALGEDNFFSPFYIPATHTVEELDGCFYVM